LSNVWKEWQEQARTASTDKCQQCGQGHGVLHDSEHEYVAPADPLDMLYTGPWESNSGVTGQKPWVYVTCKLCDMPTEVSLRPRNHREYCSAKVFHEGTANSTELLEVLQEAEWSKSFIKDFMGGRGLCPSCGEHYQQGHHSKCRFAAAILKLEQLIQEQLTGRVKFLPAKEPSA